MFATMNPFDVIANYKDGDEVGWEQEFALLYRIHKDKLDELRDSILAEGMHSAIWLGSDGRIWNGHHRLLIAIEQNLDSVPVFIYPNID
jgi:ParB-like chromosome segregation protein Spo0J